MKLYVAVNKHLSPGARVAQSCHAVIDFGVQHPEVHREWHQKSNTIVCLQADGENDILDIADDCVAEGIEHVIVREPDMDDYVTAIAVAPAGAHLLRRHKLVS